MPRFRAFATLCCFALFVLPLAAQHLPGHVLDARFLTDGVGGFDGDLMAHDSFGHALCVVGDIDGDGVDDLAVGMPHFDANSIEISTGRVWILFMTADGQVKASQRIDHSQGGLPNPLETGDQFGRSVAPAGDLNGDGVPDLWVGAHGDDDGTPFTGFGGPGALYGLMLTEGGKVEQSVKLGLNSGLALDLNGGFGSSVAVVGDLDGNGVDDLIVGAPYSDTPTNARGAVWVLRMQAGGQLLSGALISPQNLPGLASLDVTARFGISVSALGDIDNNGTPDYVIGASNDQVLQPSDGSIWFVRSTAGGGVLSVTRFGADHPVFAGNGPGGLTFFGAALARLGDLDLDGRTELAVSASNDGAHGEGAIWILRLSASSVQLVSALTRLDDEQGFVPFTLSGTDDFGSALASAGDLNDDGTPDLLVGLSGYDGAFSNTGAAALLTLRGPTFVDLGGATGNLPLPVLGASGTLVGGEDFTVQVKHGPSFGMATAVVGFSAIHAPFKGGVMVPAPDRLLSSFALDSIGALHLTAPWSLGVPLGLELVLQLWMPDVSTPYGWSATNGLRFIAGA